MGNVLESTAECNSAEDFEWLNIQNSAIFNESYLSEVYETLPLFEGTDLIKLDDEEVVKGTNLKIGRLAEIFYRQYDHVASIEDFKRLSCAKEIETSSFTVTNKKRSRLLNRIHLAYQRQVLQSSSQSDILKESYLHGIEATKNEFEDSNGLMIATSIRMSLSIIKCLGPANPALFATMASAIMDLLVRSSDLALSKVKFHSPQGESLRAVVEYAEEVVEQNSSNRQQAIGLMLAIALTTGSLDSMLSVVKYLKNGMDVLPESAKPFLLRLTRMTTPLDLTLPTSISLSGDVSLKATYNIPEEEYYNFDPSICGDGIYIYLWNGISRSIHKVGTGFHGSIPGNEYLVNQHVESQIRDRIPNDLNDLTLAPNSSSPPEPNPSDVRRYLRVIHPATIYRVPEDAEFEVYVLERFESDEGDSVVEEGLESEILEEREVTIDDETHTFYRIADRDWIPATDFLEDEDDDDDEEEENSDSSNPLRREDLVELFERGLSNSHAAGDANTAAAVYQQAWIACANGKLYLRMNHLLGPFRLAVFSCSALKLEDIVEIDLPIPDLQKAKRLWDIRHGDESKDDSICQEEKLSDDSQEGEWEYSSESNMLTPQSSIVAASSNFQGASGVFERNIIASDDLFNNDSPFSFSPGDINQELIVDLGAICYLRRVGVEFFPSDHEHQLSDRISVNISADGSEYTQFGTIIDSSGLASSPCYIALQDPTGEAVVLPPVRYIRFNFGSHAPSGQGSSIVRLYVLGSVKVKKVIQLPFPALTSDGKHLLFVANTVSNGSSCLQTFVVDPRLAFSCIKETSYKCSFNSEKELHRCSFAYNSEKLIVSHQKRFNSVHNCKESDYCFWKLDVFSGDVILYSETSFTKPKGFPVAICYDSRNNMTWGFDCYNMSLLRWRNGGLAPRYDPPRPKSVTELVLSPSASHRIEGLTSMMVTSGGSTIEAAFILCHLDRLTTPYSPPIEAMADIQSCDELEVHCAGYEDGCFCKLLVRGQLYGSSTRGFNIAVLNEDYQPCDIRSFDTHESNNDSERMADFIYSIPDGRVVMIGTCDSANANLSARGQAALSSLGAERISTLSTRGSFAMITVKGVPLACRVQKIIEKKKGALSIRVRIPAPNIPLCIEATRSAIENLVSLTSTQYNCVKQNPDCVLDKVMLLSSMRLLTSNIFQLLRGTPISKASDIFSETDRNSVMKLVMEVIDKPPEYEGGLSIADAALRLLITSIDVLYPSTTEKCALLVQYLDEFVEGSLSGLEMSVLELLLRQMSAPTSLSLLFKSSGSRDGNGGSDLMFSLISIAKKETIRTLDKIASKNSDHSKDSGSVGEAAVQMLSSLCNMMLSQGTQNIIVSKPEEVNEGKFSMIISLLSSICGSSVDILTSAAANNKFMSSELELLDDEIDESLKASPVGVLLPTMLYSFSMLFQSHGSKMIELPEISPLCDFITTCVAATRDMLCKVPKDKLFLQSTESSVSRTSNHVYESDHPYASNTDKTWELKFPGAIKMTIVFDELSKTENNYDYVKIWKNSSKSEVWHEGIEKYTGRQGTENWPGFGGRPPLVIEGDEAFVEFHSDGSNEDWGWRFTATVEYKRNMSAPQTHWLLELEKQLILCGTSISSKLILSFPWDKEKEDTNAMWLEDSLLNFGFKDENDCHECQSEESIFLKDIINRPDGSDADHLCRKMKQLVNEDQGQVDDINRAVYGTCAALIKHNNLVSEALAFARDHRREVPEQLLKVWKIGQKMRAFFAFGDVRNAAKPAVPEIADLDDLPPPSLLTRGPSIYSGADADAVRHVSDSVVSRVQFLLRVNSPIVISQSTSNSAKKKWNLLSKVALNRDVAGNLKSSELGKWHALVGEVQSAYKLKGMLSFRRQAVERKDRGAKTVSEKVLRFVQSRVDISDLEMLRTIRNRRARVRSTGFELISKLVESASSPFSVMWLMSSVCMVLRSSEFSTRSKAHVHFINGLEGCSQHEREEVSKSFFGFIEKCVSMLGYANAKFTQSDVDISEKKAWRDVIISCLRALALDYDITDHSLLDQVNIVSELKNCLQSQDFDIQRTAWSLFEVLLPRCVGLEGQKVMLNDEPSAFSNKLVALLTTELNLASEKVSIKSAIQPSSPAAHSMHTDCVDAVSSVINLRKDCVGHSIPHIQLGLNHSFSLWIKRKPSRIEEILQSGEIKEGFRVMMGPDWNPMVRDVPDNTIGTVVKVENNCKVTVKWDNKIQKSYRYGAEEEGGKKYDIVVIDEELGGHIYSKGMRSVLSDDDRSVVWSSFGLTLQQNSSFRVFISSGPDEFFYVDGKIKCPAESWTHVAVVQEKAKCQIYVNGELDCESQLPSHLLYPGKGNKSVVLVESPHPYRDNTEEYTVVEVPDAISYTITFDPRTKTEANYDFIRFYKDDSHTEYWGDEKYSGGRSGSASNWPGLNNAAPLVIPAGRFVIYFKSDGSNNDWGYLITCAAQKKSVDVSNQEYIQNLNSMPIYIGQTPPYVRNMGNNCLSSMEGLLCSMNVFSKSLSEEEVLVLSNNPPVYSVHDDEEMLCLDVLSMMHRSSQALSGIAAHASNTFIGPHILHPLMKLIVNGTPWVKAAALRLSSFLLSSYPVDMVNVHAAKNNLVKDGTFLTYLIEEIGNIFNVWSSYANRSFHERPCNELEFAIGMEKLNVLRSLAVSEIWGQEISTMIKDIATTCIPSVLSSLTAVTQQEIAMDTSHNALLIEERNLNSTYALLALCGGSLGGLYSGAQCKITVGDENSIKEDCTIIAPTWPPLEKDIPKEDVSMWKDVSGFGEAFAVVLWSQPTEYLIVPRSKIVSQYSVGDMSKMEPFLDTHSGNLIEVFTQILMLDSIDRRPVHVPKVVTTDELKEFESAHPYPDGADTYTEVSFPGAKKIIIEFNEACRTESGCDYIKFYKDKSHTSYWGLEKYSGRDSEKNWPGVDNKPLLVIPADSFVLHFHSDSSNNDWGYKFTARAQCTVKTLPPSRPPLLHLTIAQSIKMLSLGALNTMLRDHSAFVSKALPLMLPLVETALLPVPKIKEGEESRKPLVLESGHPYDHNKDDYIPVKIRGAKKLIISFSEETATENGCDYVRLYKDESKSEYWGENQYTGGKDGGNSNWPGMKGRPPLVIPADSFLLYFHSDGSVNAWGWKIIVSCEHGSGGFDVSSFTASECLYRAHCFQQVLFEGPLKQNEPENLNMFCVEPFQIECHEVCTDDSVTFENMSSQNENIISKDTFKINTKDCNEICLRESPSKDSTILHTVNGNVRMVASLYKANWLYVSCIFNEQELKGWALRRDGDLIYLTEAADDVSKQSSTNDSELVTIDDDVDGSNPIRRRHPMYDCEDTSISTLKGMKDSQLSPLDIIKSKDESIERSLAAVYQSGAIRLAEDCVTNIISKWPTGLPFTIENFGTSERMIKFLRATFDRERALGHIDDSGMDSSFSCLRSIKNRILEVIRADSQDSFFCETLVKYSLRQLIDCVKSEVKLPPTRAIVKNLQCKHPYDDNMDVSWDISIPGAKWLKLVFDKRSSTEKDCDYVVIYRDQSKQDTYGSRYTGRENGSDKVWAGVGSVPPCIVPADNCVVHFHSDGSNTDWGFSLNYYGVMEEPSEEEKESFLARKNLVKGPAPDLACWILQFLAQESLDVVNRNLYTARSIRILRTYVEVMPDDKKCFAVNLLTNLLQDAHRGSLSEDMLTEIAILKSSVISLASKKQKEEMSMSGGSNTEISQLLQALTQAAVTLEVFSDSCTTSITHSKTDFRWSDKSSSPNIQIISGTTSSTAEVEDYACAACESALSSTSNEYTVKLNSISPHEASEPIVGLMTSSGFVGVGNGNIYFPDGSVRTCFNLPKLIQGDLISVSINEVTKNITFYRNCAKITAIGPKKSNADEYFDEVVGPYYPMCKIRQASEIEIVEKPKSIISTENNHDDNASMPEWYQGVKKAVSLLKSCLTREIPKNTVLRDVIPAFEKKSCRILESEHPFNATPCSLDVTIPGAESLLIQFDASTVMGSNDIIRISTPIDSLNSQVFEYVGLKCGSNLDINTITIGDRVVRGKSWCWGQEDGGSGSAGIVTEITSWKGRSKSGVKVTWDMGYQGLYRWGYEGSYDLNIIGQSSSTMRPLKIGGNCLHFEVCPGVSSHNRVVTSDDSIWAGAYYFDGTGFIELQSRPQLELTGDCSVEAWIKIDSASPHNVILPIVARVIEIDSKMFQFSFHLVFENDSEVATLVLNVLSSTMNPSINLSGGAIKVDEWCHVACVINRTGCTIFANGVPISTGTMVNDRMLSLDAPLFIGGADDKHFIGFLYDVRIWNIARTAENIRNEKNSMPKTDLSNLVCHMITTQSSDEIIIDNIAENQPGLLRGGASWNSSVNPTVLPLGTVYGYKCTITPKFSNEFILSNDSFISDINQLQAQYTIGDTRHDHALVRYVNHVATTKSMDLSSVLNCRWDDIAPSEDHLVTMPALKELVNMTADIQDCMSSEDNTTNDTKEICGSMNRAGVQMSPGNIRNDCHLRLYCGRRLGRDLIPGSDGQCGPNNGPQCADCKAADPHNSVGDTRISVHHSHLLVLSINLSGHSCDVCQCSNSNNTFWRCTSGCDYDECIVCALKEKTKVVCENAALERNSSSGPKTVKPVEARFKLLVNLNRALSQAISFVDLCMVNKPWSIANLLASCRGLIFEVTKRPIWAAAISATTQSGSTFELRLSRPRAAKHARTGTPDNDARYMVFSQAFRQIHMMPPASLRRSDKLYNTFLMGERAHDAGGPYRESFAMYAMELQSTALPLMVRVPNEKHSVGQNREKWILNPGAVSSLHMEMFAFMGKLLGIAIRTKEYLALNIPSIIWKLLVEDTPTREDLEGIDLFQVQSLDRMRHIESEGITSESFNYIFYETFTAVSSDERVVELFPGGSKVDVTFENRKQFCDQVEQFRLHEFDRQAEAVRHGLATIIPHRLLSLYTWDQLEVMVCGLPTVDIALLKSITEYSSCSSTDQHVQYFWQALEEFSHEERSNFLRFTWGRSRLPLTADGFSQRLKLQNFNKRPADSYLPVSHTCFFSLELPAYSTLDIMKDKLRYAIFNCQAIDGDDTSVGMTAAGMGWEE